MAKKKASENGEIPEPLLIGFQAQVRELHLKLDEIKKLAFTKEMRRSVKELQRAVKEGSAGLIRAMREAHQSKPNHTGFAAASRRIEETINRQEQEKEKRRKKN